MLVCTKTSLCERACACMRVRACGRALTCVRCVCARAQCERARMRSHTCTGIRACVVCACVRARCRCVFAMVLTQTCIVARGARGAQAHGACTRGVQPNGARANVRVVCVVHMVARDGVWCKSSWCLVMHVLHMHVMSIRVVRGWCGWCTCTCACECVCVCVCVCTSCAPEHPCAHVCEHGKRECGSACLRAIFRTHQRGQL